MPEPTAVPEDDPIRFGLDDFRRMMDALPMCIILHDAQTKSILWANPSACQVLGFTLEELLPLKAPDMSRQSHEYRREIGRKWLHDATLHGSNMVEWCYRAKNGEEILSEAIATLVPLTERDVIMVQFRNIAREEQIRREMKKLESRLKEFMQDSDEGVAVLRPDGGIEYLSDAGRKLLGVRPGQNPPKNFVAQCLPDSQEELQELLTLALPDAISFPLRYRIARKDGLVRWHHAVCRYIEIENDLKGHLLHFHDITDQVEAEEARRRDQAALEYLARHNAMGEMATAIAHELSQPLAAIRNFLEGSVLRLNHSEALREQAGQIIWGLESAGRQVDHAAAIIKSVREYVVKLEQSEGLIDLNEVLAEVRWFIEMRAAEGRVQLEVQASEEALVVSCEKVLIGQVILNLAFNAIEEMSHFPENQRRVCISLARKDQQALLTVADEGRGIDAGHRERLFDGFFSSKVSGNGIGLALCKNIIARHRGDIWAQPAQVRGTRFCFTLPLVQRHN
ncbi:PAS domain-containing sensor histidine kinase [Herbaspirillum seropedicae]|uniref:PAS domain-containing sensor histidine kinase n=1 Tax=Herbaspirillum seropedicae TaxID=964 RepID=UPI0028603997|nr:ATP-binding protein [Herbaspirillum seropedicae]MDR6396674.1 PAS domain S-box-containing protein [Herbaspirillum seropedicae]